LRFELSRFFGTAKRVAVFAAPASLSLGYYAQNSLQIAEDTHHQRGWGLVVFFISAGFVFTDVCKGHFDSVIDHGRFMKDKGHVSVSRLMSCWSIVG
tara:strand:- start:110 stop:400 length:291 start_codon:yes stop_codon:yes gene_type:complete